MALLLVGVGALLGAFIAQRPGDDAAALQLRSDRIAQAQLRSEFETQLQSAQSRVDASQGEVVLERAARAQLEKNLTQTQAELDRLKDQLAFYEQLLPAGPKGSIDLRAVDFERTGQALSYRVLLMRSGKPGERFVGLLQFVAIGMQDGKEVSYTLRPLQARLPGASSLPGESGQSEDSSEIVTGSLRLEFEQFQRVQGLLALPDGFSPTSVTIQVQEEGIILASRRVDL